MQMLQRCFCTFWSYVLEQGICYIDVIDNNNEHELNKKKENRG